MDTCIRDWELEGKPTSRRLKHLARVSLCVAVLALAPGSALAGEGASTAKEGGLGMAAAVCSLVYGPTKIVYAAGGSLIAGMAWMFSGGDSEVASTVLTRAVRGTYVITPETLTGDGSVEFVGRSPEYRTATTASKQVATAPDAPDGW
jgi:hypothetical protein